MTPKYLKENLPPLRKLLYGKTNPNIYNELRGNSNFYKNSFFPSAIKSWNCIDRELHECNSIGNFKRKLNVFIRDKPKSIFGIHNPIGVRHLFVLG